jgi:hypothetical protein
MVFGGHGLYNLTADLCFHLVQNLLDIQLQPNACLFNVIQYGRLKNTSGWELPIIEYIAAYSTAWVRSDA